MLKVIQTKKATISLMSVFCSCGRKTEFGGALAPIVCYHCSNLLPDVIEINAAFEERVAYHIDKEIFD